MLSKFCSTATIMKLRISLTDTFTCSVERAFKAPILGDATKFLDGYLFQSPVVRFEEDENWGRVGGIRYPVTNGNLFIPKGRLFTDKIIDCKNNCRWDWMIYDFKVPMMFFAHKAEGKWEVTETRNNKIAVLYSYTFYSKNIFFHPFTVVFGFLQWRGMMKKALKGIRKQAESNGQFIYEIKGHVQ